MPSECHRLRSGLIAVVLISWITLRVSLIQAVDVQLAWNTSPSPEAIGYQLYYGTASGQYSVSVDTSTATSAVLSGLQVGQTYYFAALAYDAVGDQSPFSNEVKYTVPAGDTTLPMVSITAPLNGDSVPRKSTVTISATATDNVGVTTVAFYVNGQLICTDATASYTCAWKVPAAPGRTYKLQATATDAQGNVGSSNLITVTAQ
jgi:Bacterial Ig domain/Fibronectin type III domain